MRPTLAVPFLLVLMIPSPAPAQAPAAEAGVLAAQRARFAVMVRRDRAALDTLLAPSLWYTHTTGQRESEAEFLVTVASGRVRYEAIEPDSVEVQLFGPTAIVVGRARMRAVAGGTRMAFAIRFSEAYVRRGYSWELVLWQSTRLPER